MVGDEHVLYAHRLKTKYWDGIQVQVAKTSHEGRLHCFALSAYHHRGIGMHVHSYFSALKLDISTRNYGTKLLLTVDYFSTD